MEPALAYICWGASGRVGLELMSAMPYPSAIHAQPCHKRLYLRARVSCAAALMLGTMWMAGGQPLAAQSINDQPPARIVAPPAEKVDINRASIAELMRVRGITRSYAQRIVSGRPYANKGQLKTDGILPPQVYAAAKNRLIAHRMKQTPRGAR